MVMTADEIRHHQTRCQPHMLKLRMLARGETGLGHLGHFDPLDPLGPLAAEVGEATGAILAEAEASSRAALADGSHPGAATFLRVRLNRLAAAADEAVAAAREGNPADLRLHLRRFEALASAIWTVQDDLYGQAPYPRRSSGAEPAGTAGQRRGRLVG